MEVLEDFRPIFTLKTWYNSWKIKLEKSGDVLQYSIILEFVHPEPPGILQLQFSFVYLSTGSLEVIVVSIIIVDFGCIKFFNFTTPAYR